MLDSFLAIPLKCKIQILTGPTLRIFPIIINTDKEGHYLHSSNLNRNNYFFPPKVLAKVLERQWIWAMCPHTLVKEMRERERLSTCFLKENQRCHDEKNQSLHQGSTNVIQCFVVVHDETDHSAHQSRHLNTFIAISQSSMMSVEANNNI